MKPFTNEEIATALRPYYSNATPVFCDQIRTYIDLLLRWNRQISLTTVTDPLEILRFHFGESLFAVASVPIRHGRLADVGSGAGFPSVPIRMACGDIHLTLIESNNKKRAFLAEVLRELSLADVEIYPGRVESMKDQRSEFDFVTARAVAVEEQLLTWSAAHLKPGGSVALWLGRDVSSRISQLSLFKWQLPVKLPQSDRRVLLAGSKLAAQ
jgi:16S rRNA (guanine527-N7)-methyltransferase